jgi:hypothetical protein
VEQGWETNRGINYQLINSQGITVTIELAALGIFQPQLVMEFTRIRIEVVDEGALAYLSNLVVESELHAWINVA